MTAADWPVALRGVTETVVTTLGPNDRWNVAALGIDAPSDDSVATARTWGRTRTRRNFSERGEGYVQFVSDPVTFAEAALTVREESDPVLANADAWVRVAAADAERGSAAGTQWVEWELHPQESAVESETVPTIDRGFNAVVEATVAASRLDVPAYETEPLVERLAYFESVVEACGGPADHEAFAVVSDAIDAEW